MLSSPSWPPLLHLLLLLLHLLPALSFEIGDYAQCRRAKFVPGYNLVGEGFDVVTLERKGAYLINVGAYMTPRGSCRLYRNPHQGNYLQKLPISVADWRPVTHCEVHLEDTVHSSASSLINTVTNQKTLEWEVGLDLDKFVGLNVRGGRSKVYNFARTRSSEDQFSFSSHRVNCTFYRFRAISAPRLSWEFRKDLERLPSYYNSSSEDEYRNIIDTYGTHYIRKVDLGGQIQRFTATRTCLSKLNGFASDKAHECLSLGFKVGLGILSLSAAHSSCSRFLENHGLSTLSHYHLHKHYTEVVGGHGWNGEFSLMNQDSQGFHKWLESLKDHPDVISYRLRPMYKLVPFRVQRDALKAATDQYLKENSITSSDRRPSCGYSSNHDWNCCPEQTGKGQLKVTLIGAWSLKGDWWGLTEGEYFAVISHGSQSYRTSTIRSNNPQWNVEYNLGSVWVGQRLTIKIIDVDWIFENELLSCSWWTAVGSQGLTCRTDKGVYAGTMTLTCGPHLSGDHCHQYQPYVM
ncbi:perforin-1-like [Sphaeramia orbicularis]|uniref:perforin-1-like n=1 Tax=Sphaeramia orbicularis TaxID=375764 RepID=UPI001180B37D|nr:perforin-1-like [Sphaeramia orbicularis]